MAPHRVGQGLFVGQTGGDESLDTMGLGGQVQASGSYRKSRHLSGSPNWQARERAANSMDS